jgi:excisionase family DNA binding protein
VPDGFVALNEAARLLGCARQTVLHKVHRGELEAIQVTRGRREGSPSRFPPPAWTD